MIQLHDIGVSFPHKTCFSEFNATIKRGQRIAIVGDNGCGKSSLLRILYGSLEPSEGKVTADLELSIGYVAQEHGNKDGLSGGQRVNKALSQAMASASDVLLLDEPTNHLDDSNRRSLSRMLQSSHNNISIVLVTHDETLMNEVCDTIWHIQDGRIEVFSGRYMDYIAEKNLQRKVLEKKLVTVKSTKNDIHKALMKENERASHARQRGIKSIQNRKWATVKSPTKLSRASSTAGRKQAEMTKHRKELLEQLSQLNPVKVVTPRFHLPAVVRSKQTVLQVTNGAVGYEKLLFGNINFSLAQGERLAIKGRNGSGKSTLARAIIGDPEIIRSGDWLIPQPRDIGYLDQHYANLNPNHTVLQALMDIVPDWSQPELRNHLSNFLFRQNELVNTQVFVLSGGEKARLSLACIAAKAPPLLILDELTNNLDITTRQHVIDILQDYPGTLILISHDMDFLTKIRITKNYVIDMPCQ
ncbi:ABC-F family ATP-binding cassette domain-containing protein [Xenorhabdus lircayensis]|nr:ATP-binding cassette domain-containing protein [Xenorhabdus lircayensis]